MDFNKEEVEKLILDVKAKVFGDALDRNLSTEDAVKEVQKVEKETREFLEKEEVKETVKEIKKINKELKKVEEKQKKLEEETPGLKGNGSTEQPKTAETGAPELQTSAEMVSPDNKINGLDEKKIEEYQQVLSEKNILAKKVLDLGVSLKKYADEQASKCGWNSSIKEHSVEKLTTLGIATAIGATVGAAIGVTTAVAAEAGIATAVGAGILKALFVGTGIYVAGEATAKVTDLSAEAAVTYAISQADTEEEAQSYADLVMSMVEWGMIGLSVFGAYKGVKGKVPALRNTFSKAKISELFGLSRAKKTATTASVSETTVTKNVKEVEILNQKDVKSGVESWQVRKAKIKGKAQVTGTPGHEFGSMRIAVKESKKSDVEVIYMDKSLKDVTNEEVSSRKRPDVTVVRKDGRIITHEVKSKSQTKTELRDKIDKMQKSLPENRRDLEGISDVFDVEGRKI